MSEEIKGQTNKEREKNRKQMPSEYWLSGETPLQKLNYIMETLGQDSWGIASLNTAIQNVFNKIEDCRQRLLSKGNGLEAEDLELARLEWDGLQTLLCRFGEHLERLSDFVETIYGTLCDERKEKEQPQPT